MIVIILAFSELTFEDILASRLPVNPINQQTSLVRSTFFLSHNRPMITLFALPR
jgi:hypothetical protein